MLKTLLIIYIVSVIVSLAVSDEILDGAIEEGIFQNPIFMYMKPKTIVLIFCFIPIVNTYITFLVIKSQISGDDE